MYPWGHAAFAYLLFVGLALLAHRRVSRAQLVAVLVASQLPDLIDKPLAWWVPLLPSGRSLGHSLLFALPLVATVGVLAHRIGRFGVAPAVAVGYLGHLLGDAYVEIYYWRVDELTYLFWPVLPPYPYDTPVPLSALVGNLTVTADLLAASLAALVGCTVFAVHFAVAPRWSPSE
ncbi:membrane-bound metal-dependent hydrolase [Halosimplex carlsbadense 2-9-1]|uniref:Membrane-bound metal-dependent hydrolase n=1 Tax=Halosimplex carlsbadense 2-9-1 TaxID=797114 RepID=M0CLV8_9EURY|nr:metal-dependent hydrolase [Halosimplex carlsbadense]ELZ24236.1 membrane-bound metal-dependent hydrolase [Halosimplex carlsbadense 2-9-1]